MKTNLHAIFSTAIFLACFSAIAQQGYWKSSSLDRSARSWANDLDKDHYTIYRLASEDFKKALIYAPKRSTFSGRSNTMISFPNEKGELEQFRVMEVKTLSDEIAKKHPTIKTYLGIAESDPLKRIRFSVTPSGVKTMLTKPGQSMVFSEPIPNRPDQYIVYSRDIHDEEAIGLDCLTDKIASSQAPAQTRGADDQMLRTFEIAITTTAEYTNFWDDGSDGDPKDDAFDQVVATLNRVNEVFETDMAISFTLVSGTNIIYDDPITDPFNQNGYVGGQSQFILDTTIGSANYDIGHVFDYEGGSGGNVGTGNAGCIGCVCNNGSKGSGWSAHLFIDNDGGPYMSDFFDVDYVCHEIGHQMGANHTWSFVSEGTGVNVEPGSGSTIMGYAGIEGINDVQDHSDPYFHYESINQVLNNVGGKTCQDETPIANEPPAANAGPDHTIPQGTAFVLRGSATDDDSGDTLTYCWEQIDNGISNNGNFGPTRNSSASFRSRPPSISPDRYMPIMERVVAGQLTETSPVETVDNTSWETVSTVGRSLNFALTVRDRMPTSTGQTPQSSFDTMTVTVDENSGPFVVTSQTTNETWSAGSAVTISWDVAGTDGSPVNVSNVNIKLSTDGGLTFPMALTPSAVPNDGSQEIVVPSGINTESARVMIEAAGNIFFAINSTDFTINDPLLDFEDIAIDNFAVYPNPNNGEFTIAMRSQDSLRVLQVELFDITGRKVYDRTYDGSLATKRIVNVGRRQHGLYFLRISDGNLISVQRMVIRQE